MLSTVPRRIEVHSSYHQLRKEKHFSDLRTRAFPTVVKNGFYSSPMWEEKPRLDHGVLQHVVGLPAMKNGSQFFKHHGKRRCIWTVDCQWPILSSSNQQFGSTTVILVVEKWFWLGVSWGIYIQKGSLLDILC